MPFGSTELKAMNKFFLIALTAPMLALSGQLASANLGDTHKQSDARYGKAYKTDGFSGITRYAPKGKGWMILEWFNKQGIVEAVEYYQVSGEPIIQTQVDQFFALNQISSNCYWQTLKEDASGTIWIVPTKQLRMELSWDATMGGKPIERLILSSFDGFLGIQAALEKTATDLPASI